MNAKKRAFVKMQGCGNDYIYFDCFDEPIENPEALSMRLSAPHFGIGGDGIILIEPSEVADGRMRIFNRDGSEGKMCGNGIRCVGKYLYDSGRVPKTNMQIETKSGIKELSLEISEGIVIGVTVNMGAAILTPERVPVNLPGEKIIAKRVMVGGRQQTITCVSMGNPHCVIFEEKIGTLNLTERGASIEHDPIFPESVNTEFVEVLDSHALRMRVWERGSGETLSCGTGACAAVVAAVENGFCPKNEEITVHLAGGDLRIRYTDETVYMTGEAITVFTGEIAI